MDLESKEEAFEPSLVKEPVAQSCVLDPLSSSRTLERTVPEYDDADFQSHRNVYVAVHMPYSHSKHRSHSRHKRKHRHGNGHGHHGNDSSRDSHGDGNDVSREGAELPEDVTVDTAADTTPHRRRVSLDMRSMSVVQQEDIELEGWSHHRFNKSHSLPTGSSIEHNLTIPSKLEPITPSDPCDRVKFILGGDHDDHTDCHDNNTAHSIFTELEELKYDEHEHRMEWKETARWIKFEEDVEEGGNKWSKPHVATLSLHSLFELRSCIFRGTVLLDMAADNLATISDIVLDNLVSTGQLEEENRERVRTALLQRHHHLNSKKDGDKKILKSLSEITRHGSKDFDPLNIPGNLNGSKNNSRRGSILTDAGIRNGSIKIDDDATDEPRKPDSNFMKKLPPGSEASNVLVGEVDFLSQPIIAFVRLARGQYLGDITEVPIPTRFIFIMLGPMGKDQDRYHEIGRSISTLMSDEVFHEVAYKARNRGDLMAGIDEFLDKVTVLPPGEWDPQIRLEPPSKVPSQAKRKNAQDTAKLTVDTVTEPYKCKHCKNNSVDHPEPTKWTKRPFHGLIKDMTRCYSLYRSDFSDAVSLQIIASLILIYFANITIAFTFGAVLSDQTNNTLGATETILAVGIGNFFYSIFSTQPLVILGPTGPTLIFEQIVYTFCDMQQIPFLEFRFWIGLWTALFMFVLVGLNSSAVTRLFTRFTQEIFTVLIGLIFIYQSLHALWEIHINYPYNEWIIYPTKDRECSCYRFPSREAKNSEDISNATRLGSFWNQSFQGCRGPDERFVGRDCPSNLMVYDNVFLMSVILLFGTFLLCVYFKKTRNSRCFKSYIRHLFSDFAVFLAVVVWVVVDILARVDTPKLEVANVFQEGVYSKENRSFLINPLGNGLPMWATGAAIIPALLATILLFMDQHITAIIINKKDNKLQKQTGYHLDFTIIGVLIFIHSLLGLPWVVGATILSISHVQSLYKYSSRSAPGEPAKFIGVREQRVTLFFMAIFIGISVMAYSVLKLLPLPVLYGLVLYLGVSSLYGVQFLQRFKLFFIPNKYKPDYEYLRHIPNWRISVYTAIQIGLLIFLCIFHAYFYLKVLFPIMIVALVVGRWLLGFWFSKHDLELLDDPIPDSLYCRPCRDKQTGTKALDLEGNGSYDTLDSSSPNISTKDVAIVCDAPPSTGQQESNFNITTEVDRCDLWKNMVKTMDTPPTIGRAQSSSEDQLEEGVEHTGVAMETVRNWEEWARNPSLTLNTNRCALDTLEECENEMDTPVLSMPNYKGVGSELGYHEPYSEHSEPSYHEHSEPSYHEHGDPPYHEHWSHSEPHEHLGLAYQSTAV